MKSLAFIRTIDPILGKTILFLFVSILLIFCIGFPNQKSLIQKQKNLFQHQYETEKLIQIQQALSKQEKMRTFLTSSSLVHVLEEEAQKLGLENKIIRMTPYARGVDFEMEGIALKELLNLLTQIERIQHAGQVVSIKLVPKSEEAILFYLHAKLEKF